MQYYLYGLQRSGTNVIETFLKKTYNIQFSNKGNRGEIGHKHFRIYNNKKKIPICIQHQYNNNIIINKYEDLVNELTNKVNSKSKPTNLEKNVENIEEKNEEKNEENTEESSIEKNVKIFVVIKDIFSWLISIKKWADQCKWTPFNQKEFIEEYALYVKKWIELEKNTTNICIIYYEDYINFIKNQKYVKSQNDNFIIKLNTFLDQNIPLKINSEIKKVDCSDEFDKESMDYYYYKKYMNIYSTQEINKIEKFLQI